MIISRLAPAARHGLLLAAAGIALPGTAVADGVDLTASYAITLAIFTIGHVDVSVHFTSTGYSASVKGSTSGLGRLVSDSHAELTGSGSISGSHVSPAAFSMRTAEGDFDTRVDIRMSGGTVANVDAEPMLIDAPDRVPLTPATLKNVLDPVGALVVARTGTGPPDGNEVCNRTVPVFDGWVRYDVALSYKETTNVSTRGAGAYSGPAIVCQARYVPVAGHRLSHDAVQYMAQDQRLEAWIVPVKGTNLMVPFKFIIGTAVGDLSVTAREFAVTGAPTAASR